MVFMKGLEIWPNPVMEDWILLEATGASSLITINHEKKKKKKTKEPE